MAKSGAAWMGAPAGVAPRGRVLRPAAGCASTASLRSRRVGGAALAGVLLVAAGLAALPARAAPTVVVYRCTAADGAVTLQNDRRCPKGQREERRVLEAPVSRAPVAPAAPVPAAATPNPRATAGTAEPGPALSPTPADTAPLIELAPAPAPPVFACRSWDGRAYYGDSERPEPRCAPLATVGLDGRSPGAAPACELRADTCEPVIEAARCDAWAERLRQAEAAERFGDADTRTAAAGELARLRTIVAGTVCAR